MEQNNRIETRRTDGRGSSVEFKPGESLIAYQFKLRDYSSQGLGILVKEDSNVLKLINVGDILKMKYYQGDDRPDPVFLKTKIQHISPPDKGRHRNHIVIGLHILD